MMQPFPILPLLCCAILLFACAAGCSKQGEDDREAANYGFEIVNRYPHDVKSFTQGLVYHDGILIESTGKYGKSTLRKIDLQSGTSLSLLRLPARYFGEGIAVYDNKIIQLTWRSETGFIYDLETFEKLDEVSYEREGWGITYDGKRLIMSDGSATLYFKDPDTFADIGRIQVRDSDGPVKRLNELEWVKGEVLANVWMSDRIARIDPDTGKVRAWIDLTHLLPQAERSMEIDALNGIAYDADADRLFVTGKLWPSLFEIRLVEVE